MRRGKGEKFFGEPLQRLRKQIESHFGFQILLARTEVGGYCAHCQALRAREVEALREQPAEPARPPRRTRTAQKYPYEPRACRRAGYRTSIAGGHRSKRKPHSCTNRAAAFPH